MLLGDGEMKSLLPGFGASLQEAATVRCPPLARPAPSRGVAGMTLVEALIAVAILGITLICMMSGISYMRIQNRSASERMLAASIGAQIIEKFKALPYAEITNSTTDVSGTGAIYLEGMGSATPNAAWYVPQAGQWQTLPVEDVDSTSPATPQVITDKLPEGVWSVQFTSPSSPPGLKQITVTIDWNVYAGATEPPCTYSISTIVSSYIPNL